MSVHCPNPRLIALVLLTLAFASLNAQDVTIGTPVTFKGLDDGQNRKPIKLKSSPKPQYPPALRGTEIYGYAIAFSPSERDKAKGGTYAQNVSTASSILKNATRKEIEIQCVKALSGWQWEAGVSDKNDSRRAWVAIIFNPASASGSKKNTAPRLLDVVPVFVQPGVKISLHDRVAQADVTVGVSGEIKDVKITSTSKFALAREDEVAASVSSWKIAPARVNGIPTEATINVPILFLNGSFTDKLRPAPITRLNPIEREAAIYPVYEGDSIGNNASVTLEFTLDDKGCPQNPIVVLSPNKILDAPALSAIRKYRFERPDPSMPDSFGNTHAKLSDAHWQYVVNFYQPTPLELDAELAVNFPGSSIITPTSRNRAAINMASVGIRPSSSFAAKGQNITVPVLPPESVEPVAPVYPYPLLKCNVTGSATARLSRASDKSLESPEVIDASKKEFGLALAAALRFYDITLARFMGKAVPTMLNVTFDFNPANPDLHLTEKTMRLLSDETKNPQTIIPENKLDSPLRIQRAAPASSNGLCFATELNGLTIVEFLVDETGRVHLPRIIKAPIPDLAYALMQQISMRVYDPPLQNGKPVVARARETLNLDKPTKILAGE